MDAENPRLFVTDDDMLTKTLKTEKKKIIRGRSIILKIIKCSGNENDQQTALKKKKKKKKKKQNQQQQHKKKN